jgi:hypothetical protein
MKAFDMFIAVQLKLLITYCGLIWAEDYHDGSWMDVCTGVTEYEHLTEILI